MGNVRLAILTLGVALLAAACTPPETQSREVPTYRVTGVGLDETRAATLASLLEIDPEGVRRDAGTFSYLDAEMFQHVPTTVVDEALEDPEEEDGTYRIEAFQLGQLDGYEVPSDQVAVERAESALTQAEALPSELFAGNDFAVTREIGHSTFQTTDAAGTVQLEIDLDTQVIYTFSVRGDAELVPLTGPGAKVKLVFDGNGLATQVHHAMRTLEPGEPVSIITAAQAADTCESTYIGETEKNDRPGTDVSGETLDLQVDAQLVYYAPPLDVDVATIHPYYLCTGTAAGEEGEVLLREVLVQATDEAPPVGDASQPTAATVAPQLLGRTDVGIEWIGESQGLGGSERNAGGFADAMAADGVVVQFDWGDANAWEQDFKDPSLGGDDSAWVDDVDAVFYTGHANGNGFTFPGDNDDGRLDYDEAVWGNRNLEWLVIAACGPLQSNAGGLSWVQRWGDAFDGLHLMLAYANVSRDNTREGRIYAEGLLGTGDADAPLRVRHAWVRAATEVQPSSVTYAYMGVFGADGESNFNDYFWGRGAGGGPDIRNVNGYWKVSGPS